MTRFGYHKQLMRSSLSAFLFAITAITLASPGNLQGQQNDPRRTIDARVGLAPGLHDAEEAISNLELISTTAKGPGFSPDLETETPYTGGYTNSDLAFKDNYSIVGNYQGFQVYNVEDPNNPTLQVSLVCPGGQGDVSVYGDLLFMSVQERRARLDCGTQGVADSISSERFRGVRIFDISDIRNPEQIAAVQTCRGSHTHTVVNDPQDDQNVYVYVSGTSSVRPSEELAGCSGLSPEEDPNTSYFRIEVIQVPLANPETARVVNAPRLFMDQESGDISGLHQGGDFGPGTQSSRQTNQCHDITVYPELGLAAGACSGNGILLDITDVVNPVRIDEVTDPGFAYWHSATFSNDGSKVIFTDEWGGGGAPRCRDTDPLEWGADAIFEVVGRKLLFAGYYKLTAPQTELENCVAHNGSIIPVPGRDIKVQAWYQGGLSVFDFTDPANAVEIAYFDRGPVYSEEMVSGGYWSTYWYNGHIYGAEIARGFDVFKLVPSEHLTQNEIDAAGLIRMDEFNAQLQPKIEWPTDVVVARAYLDQLMRSNAIRADRAVAVSTALDRVGNANQRADMTMAATDLREVAGALEADSREPLANGQASDRLRMRSLAESIRNLASSLLQ
ncbi:MAG: LVIVD repeat-containing protein [Longimicrobiales bacterium]